MNAARDILIDIKDRKFQPIYFLMGDEAYYIDQISEYISSKVLTEAEKGFNQMVLYGKDVSIEDIVGSAKRFPMMSEYQVLIVKEAQNLSRSIESLATYANNPQPTTILVLCYKYKRIDKRKKLYKAVQKNGILFDSKKLYENQVSDWIRGFIANKKYKISPKACELLAENLGTDLGRISNELEKLFLAVSDTNEISAALIEKHIGINKDFNNFELKKAIGTLDIKKAYRIITYFTQNEKDNPFVLTLSLLYTFFVQLLKYHGLRDKSSKNVASELGISPFFVKEYEVASRNYPMKKVSRIIANLRQLDVKSKGVGASNYSNSDLYKELLTQFI